MLGEHIDSSRLPALEDLCRIVLGDERAVAHDAWPGLVEKLMDLTVDFAELTEDIFGGAIHPNDDESGTMEGISDEHQYSVDLVLGLLARPAAVASKHWADLVSYVCAEKKRKLGYWSFGEAELEALFASPAVKKHRRRKALLAEARKAWPFAKL